MSGTRSYSSPRRDEDARRTRLAIIDAAARLFARDGYAATPVRAIAEAAGVSVQSVSLVGPKATLLVSAFERTFAGDDEQLPLMERPELARILAQPDRATMLQQYVTFIAEGNERAGGIWRALMAAADADDAVREVAAGVDRRRRSDIARGADLMVELGMVSPGWRDQAADVLGFLTVPSTYLYFVEQSGWSRQQYEQWLLPAIVALVFDDDARLGSPGEQS